MDPEWMTQKNGAPVPPPRPRDMNRAIVWGFGVSCGVLLFAVLLAVVLPVGCATALAFFAAAGQAVAPSDTAEVEARPEPALYSQPAEAESAPGETFEPAVAEILAAKETAPPPPPPSAYATFVGIGDGKAIIDVKTAAGSQKPTCQVGDVVFEQWRMSRFIGDRIVEISNRDTSNTAMLPMGVPVPLP
jgi:hypothetical protein